MTDTGFTCKICGTSNWSIMYAGSIRLGKFGNWSQDSHTIWRCSGCRVGFLPSSDVDYESSEYRLLVDGDSSCEAYYAAHDKEQAENLQLLGTDRLRNKVVADVGCGAGSFLDLMSGFCMETVAVEPAVAYREVLSKKGHLAYSYCRDALEDYAGKVDLVVSFLTVEHVNDPVEFLSEIRDLLAPEGEAIITTPNSDDWLIEFLPGVYDRFFFRLAHRWYFDGRSLREVAVKSGFSTINIEFIQRYDLSNALLWTRDGAPTGLGGFESLADLDQAYARLLEQTGRANWLCARLGN